VATQVTEEVLIMGGDMLKLAPVVGLDVAVKVLAGIWAAAQDVQVSDFLC